MPREASLVQLAITKRLRTTDDSDPVAYSSHSIDFQRDICSKIASRGRVGRSRKSDYAVLGAHFDRRGVESSGRHQRGLHVNGERLVIERFASAGKADPGSLSIGLGAFNAADPLARFFGRWRSLASSYAKGERCHQCLANKKSVASFHSRQCMTSVG